jgi:hypothetical protein
MQQTFFSEQINIGDLHPPRRQKIFGQCTILGFSGTINYQYCSIFKRILHDYPYLNDKLRAFWLFDFFISYFTNTWGGGGTISILFPSGGALPPPPGPPSATGMNAIQWYKGQSQRPLLFNSCSRYWLMQVFALCTECSHLLCGVAV